MLDQVSIFHRGGAVLWSRAVANSNKQSATTTQSNTPSAAATSEINTFITEVLVQEKATANNVYRIGDHLIRWSIDNQLHLVVVAVYLNVTSILYIEQLLEALKKEFSSLYKQQLTGFNHQIDTLQQFNGFDKRYDALLSKYEQRGNTTARPAINSNPPTIQQQQPHALKASDSINSLSSETTQSSSTAGSDEDDSTDGENNSTQLNGSSHTLNGSDSHLLLPTSQKNTPRKPGGFKGKKKQTKDNTSTDDSSTASSSSKKKGKAGRSWEGQSARGAEAAALDRSIDKPADSGAVEDARIKDLKAKFFVEGETKEVDYSGDEGSDSDSDDDVAAPASASGWLGKTLSSVTRNVTGLVSGRTLTDEDLQPVTAALKQQLMSKNVAMDIAEKLCDSVQHRLVGTKTTSFQTIRSVVKAAVEQHSLTRILTPKKPVDVLQGVELAREQRRPYTVVFVGVNGVGKSTSLSKVAAYFGSKNMKVGFAACDTFRAGAIEQLRTHATCLNVPLYAKGYDKDAAAVAAEAVQSAKRDQLDVLLIDTAGRMQHNEPLMRALAKLIHLNTPDLVLFVGEALVGNDAVDQITEFNRSLVELSEHKLPRLIDGIILTKFDTIDDKVGAAISLTYTTGIPIVFVGTGQTYRDLKKLNVKTINKMLLK